MTRWVGVGLAVLSCLGSIGPVYAASAARNPANEYLQGQSAAGRATALGKAIGQDCTARTTFYMGLGVQPGTRQQAFWSVKCTNGDTFVVEVNPNGSNQVLRCSAFEVNDTGKCFKKLPGS